MRHSCASHAVLYSFMSKQVAVSHASSKLASVSSVLNIPTQRLVTRSHRQGSHKLGLCFFSCESVRLVRRGEGGIALSFQYAAGEGGGACNKEEWEVRKLKCSFYLSQQ